MKLTVIIPAAGEGSRLNLNHSKEVLKVNKDTALIDFVFEHFKDYGRKDVEFVITINEKKTDIIEYVSKYKNRYNISFTFLNPYEQEYTGSIKSAQHLFGEHNVVMLPDTVMKLPTGVDLLETVKKCLTETGFTFFYKKEDDFDRIKSKGGLIVNDESLIINYTDKPETDEGYNAYWTAFAFRNRTFQSIMNFMEKSTLRQRVSLNEIENTPIYKSKGIEVEDYIDLGTWPDLRRFLSRYE